MTAKDIKEQSAAPPQDEQLQLLHRVEGKLDAMNGKLDHIHQRVRKEAIVCGATAGGLASCIISAGVALAKAKLGM